MTAEKTHWKKNFNYDYLGCYSLLPGQEIVLTIKQMKKDGVIGADGKKQECFIAFWQEDQKPMILNRTNCKVIAKIYESAFIEDWVGKRVQIYQSTVKAFGEMTECLRIRNFIPVDTTQLIAQIKACKTEDELLNLYNTNKNLWTDDVKAAGQEVSKLLKAAK